MLLRTGKWKNLGLSSWSRVIPAPLASLVVNCSRPRLDRWKELGRMSTEEVGRNDVTELVLPSTKRCFFISFVCVLQKRESFYVFVAPPSLDCLENRLRERGGREGN